MPLSCNLGTLTSWNPLGHSRPVTGLLDLYRHGLREKPPCKERAIGRNLALQVTFILCLAKVQVLHNKPKAAVHPEHKLRGRKKKKKLQVI